MKRCDVRLENHCNVDLCQVDFSAFTLQSGAKKQKNHCNIDLCQADFSAFTLQAGAKKQKNHLYLS
jgi:hypothetical protein